MRALTYRKFATAMFYKLWTKNFSLCPLRRYIEMRGETWEEIQENRKWEIRDGWRFLCNSRCIPLKMT